MEKFDEDAHLKDPEVREATTTWLRIKEVEARKAFMKTGMRPPAGIAEPPEEGADPGTLTARTEMFRALLKRHNGEELTPLQRKTCEFVDKFWGAPEPMISEVEDEIEDEIEEVDE